MPVVNTQLITDSLVVVVDCDLESVCDGDHHQRDPRTMHELGSQDDEEDRTGHHEADDIDSARAQHTHAFLTRLASAQLPVPMTNHAQLRKGKGNEDTDDVELDQTRGLCVETHDQRNRCDRENNDAIRIRKAVAAALHLVG